MYGILIDKVFSACVLTHLRLQKPYHTKK